VRVVCAELAWFYFEFIWNVTRFITQEAEKFIIHITFSKDLNESLSTQPKKD